MIKRELLFIKLGGSVITYKKKAFSARRRVIKRLGREIQKSREKFVGDIILVHGQGSFAHIPASKYQTQKGIINKKSFRGLSEVSDCAIRTNRIVMNEFLDISLNAVSFAPMSLIISNNGKLHSSFVDPIKRALSLGFVPVLYGDTIFDIDKRGFCIYSGEKVIAILLKRLYKDYKKVKIIYCTDTDGVYDKKGKTIPVINRKMYRDIVKSVGGSSSVDVTGGMLHKVEQSLNVAMKYGSEIYIISGLIRNCLVEVINGNKKGTLISG